MQAFGALQARAVELASGCDLYRAAVVLARSIQVAVIGEPLLQCNGREVITIARVATRQNG